MRISHHHLVRIILGTTFLFQFGCSVAPTTDAKPAVGLCNKLSIIQYGNEMQPVGGVFRIDRQPFVVRYRGSESDPALSVSVNNELPRALERQGRKYLWGSSGSYMAYGPSDLPLLTEFTLYIDAKSRDQFASMIGDGYVELLRRLVSNDPALDTASTIPKAAGDFKRDKEGNSYRYDIQKLHGLPVSQIPVSELYVTYFGTVERFGPPQQGRYQYQSLLKLNWGTCQVKLKP